MLKAFLLVRFSLAGFQIDALGMYYFDKKLKSLFDIVLFAVVYHRLTSKKNKKI